MTKRKIFYTLHTSGWILTKHKIKKIIILSREKELLATEEHILTKDKTKKSYILGCLLIKH